MCGDATIDWIARPSRARRLLSGYYLFNASSGKVLTNPFSPSNRAAIQQYQLYGVTNQQWNFIPLSNGTYEIVNQCSSLVLGDPGYSTSNGSPIIQWQWNGGMNEQWYVYSA